MGLQRSITLSAGCAGDSLTTVRWVQGKWKCRRPELRGLLDQVIGLASALDSARVRRRSKGSELVRHVYHEFNVEADALAGSRTEGEEVCQPGLREYWRLCFDSFYVSACSNGGLGWVLEGARPCVNHGREHEWDMQWEVMAKGSSPLAGVSSSIEAELHALRAGFAFLFRHLGREPKWVASASGAPMKARRLL